MSTAEAKGTGTVMVLPVRLSVYGDLGLQAPAAVTGASPKVTRSECSPHLLLRT